MKATAVSLEELLSPLKQYFLKDTFIRKDINNAPPLRAELFTLEQFEQQAVDLAIRHEVTSQKKPEQLLRRLAKNEEVLLRVMDLLQESVKNKTPISPAGEWLLDNFYLIEEQIQIGKKHLPKGYSKGLPKLQNTGLPRVYEIATEIISHSDGHLDIHILNRFIESYQKKRELTLGELWAIPIMLRLALLENLRRVAARIAIDRIDANSAHHWADCIIQTAEHNPKNLVITLADMARSNPPLVSAFIAEYSRKLQWKGINLTLPLSWMEQNLSESGDTINGMVLAENQKQAADHVTMSNSIKSLRFLAKTNWRKFVESMSLVEQTLRTDAGNVYSRLDFQTRDKYRHSIERLAKRISASENDVAKIVVQLAREEYEKQGDERKSHVGYYLIGDGLKTARRTIHYSRSMGEFFRELADRRAPFFYGLCIFFLTIFFTAGIVYAASRQGMSDGLFYLMVFLGFLGANHLAIALTNWVAGILSRPSFLPKMDFSEGIPDECRTMVVVPSLLSSHDQVKKMAEDLEVRFLGNRDPNLLFALLTDFTDAPSKEMPGDTALLSTAAQSIQELNQKYFSGADGRFFLFHRPREWNKENSRWMGRERKRGKLGDLNKLLRGGPANHFSRIIGKPAQYSHVKFIITLDTDTLLPREAACKLVGTLAHPLNRPVYHEKKKRVVNGYGILQPRVDVSMSGSRSPYARLHQNDAGIDPYTRLTSDVYQDIFNEGSFIGKGIYDLDMFEKVLSDRFPDNRILSHDLLEGNFTRSGLVSDIQFYEEYPSTYMLDMSRRQRWVRGDWQIWNWFLPWVPDAKGKWVVNPTSALSKWKIADNLRRSIVPGTLLCMLLLGWTILWAPVFWTAMFLAVTMIPSLTLSGWHLIRKPKDVTLTRHLENIFENTVANFFHGLFLVACLPYEALINTSAILITLYRLLITKRNLLEWNPSGFLKNFKESFLTIFLKMIIGPVLGGGMGYLLYEFFPGAFYVACPFLFIWIISPAIVWWISRPVKAYKSTLTADQKIYLRETARKTWAFFESLVTAEENWLPPDNLQQYPIVKIAHRTSPTNIGINLISNLAAHDFGYITTGQLLKRTANTFTTLAKLERYAGHFFNWYDTQSLATLHPRYISTVDSGNLAGYLITLKHGLSGILDAPVVRKNIWEGLFDTMAVLYQHITPDQKAAFAELRKEFEGIDYSPASFTRTLEASLVHFGHSLDTFIAHSNIRLTEPVNEWTTLLKDQLNGWLEEVVLFHPPVLFEARPASLQGLVLFKQTPSLNDLITADAAFEGQLKNYKPVTFPDEDTLWIEKFRSSLQAAKTLAQERILEVQKLSAACDGFSTMDFSFLFDKSQLLISIGYNADDHRLDQGYYDLLASEARLAIFIAIAQGQIPQESWFALGRRLTEADSNSVLLSWSGSMFEYLMPNLIMPTYENTLLDETMRGCVRKQISYGRERGVPWGISESCYNMVDAHLTYQYRAFGVPELGFKRGLRLDLVVAPYATILALMVDPAAAYKNLARLHAKGYIGKFGFFESIDFSPARLTRSRVPALIQTFMAHHQGMSLLSLNFLLCNQPMQKRFEADVNFQTALFLLQERIPRSVGFHSLATDSEEIVHATTANGIRVIRTANTPHPELQLLSNGAYHVMITNAGSGYTRYKNIAVTRWREDTTRDNWGSFCYVRDLRDGSFWSNTYQPTLKEADSYEAIFSQGRADFRRLDKGIELHSEIIVSPEDNVEIRRIHIVNHSRWERKLELTSYGEVVITQPASDDAHPSFSNLFIQTEILEQQHAILCNRRPRTNDESSPWIFHLMKIIDGTADKVSYETDRYKFIGRGNSTVSPQVMKQEGPLSNTQGPVLDPIVSIQYRITLSSETAATIDIVTGAAETRALCQNQVDKYQDHNFRNRAFELTWTHSQVILRQINAQESDVQLFSQIASSILYTNPSLRAQRDVLSRNNRGQAALWAHSVSGDLPIILLLISDSSNMTLVKQLLQARSYWLFKGVAVDLIIINEDHSGYRQVLQEQIQSLVAAGFGINPSGKLGNILVKFADQISTEDRILFHTVARVILSDKNGSLQDQVNARTATVSNIPLLSVVKPAEPYGEVRPATLALKLDNGLGGFSADGSEYVVTTGLKRTTPLPWCNVIANPEFGTIVTESGPVYTWAENAHEFRLTPWNNDPLSNAECGEAFYLRDEESGKVWSPMPFPATGTSPYVTRHGFGYSVFETRQEGISTEAWIYAAKDDALKFTVIKIRNASGKTRSLSVTGYVEWVMGSLRPSTAMHIVTELDPELQALITKNPYNTDFPNRVAFFDVQAAKFTFTTDRNEFIGRNGSLKNPDALKRLRLSGRQGAGYDPCAAIQVPVQIYHGQEVEIIFRLGASRDLVESRRILSKLKGREAAANALTSVRDFWRSTLGHTRIKTPDEALNTLTNGWLLYEVISCRLWGRSGFYQSGGAFGFRDQLQDVIAIMHTAPEAARDHILLSASRQFVDGDVQHWWHPPQGRGVRTLCSDDLLWLPYTVSRYVSHTQDFSILHEPVSFIEGRELNADQESSYDLPVKSEQSATIYEHCKRAINRTINFGEHGLPLMGSGDWNDGMNMVGIHGKGESVWLAFFLFDILNRFESIGKMAEDPGFSRTCAETADKLKLSINQHAWDGKWYRRAYFDDGTPLGSSLNSECQIDSVSQSWAVLSGAASPERCQQALQSVEKQLVDKKNSLIRLLDPPFNHIEKDPGYIKGYLPGVRENGGQYSHAAIWLVMAMAKLGKGEKVWELLNIINPVNHTKSPEEVSIYKTEPYVMAADIYGVPPHTGRGGWTWYTGSAGWMYQLILESFLGLKREGPQLSVSPCIPSHWNSFEVDYRFGKTLYKIKVVMSGEEVEKTGNKVSHTDHIIHLEDDGETHEVLLHVNRIGIKMAEAPVQYSNGR